MKNTILLLLILFSYEVDANSFKHYDSLNINNYNEYARGFLKHYLEADLDLEEKTSLFKDINAKLKTLDVEVYRLSFLQTVVRDHKTSDQNYFSLELYDLYYKRRAFGLMKDDWQHAKLSSKERTFDDGKIIFYKYLVSGKPYQKILSFDEIKFLDSLGYTPMLEQLEVDRNIREGSFKTAFNYFKKVKPKHQRDKVKYVLLERLVTRTKKSKLCRNSTSVLMILCNDLSDESFKKNNKAKKLINTIYPADVELISLAQLVFEGVEI